MKTIYGIVAPIDEYRSALLENMFFTKHEVAESLSKNVGWYESDGQVHPIFLFDSKEEYNEWKSGETKRKAIENAKNKLTAEERRALGLKF